MPPIIRVHDLCKVYRVGTEKVHALDHIDLTIEKGEICCIVGTSGSGKSTLLNQLAGLEPPTRGSVHIGKYNISKMSENELASFRQRHIGFIFQSYNLFMTMTALENTAAPLLYRGMPRQLRTKKAVKILREVGLGDRMKHKAGQLSGGQQQRVGIARAFVANPAIVFADEPTGNLDSRTTIEVMELLVRLAREHMITFILVTHDTELAEYADRVVTLKDGRIIDDCRKEPTPPAPADGPPQETAAEEAPTALEFDPEAKDAPSPVPESPAQSPPVEEAALPAPEDLPIPNETEEPNE